MTILVAILLGIVQGLTEFLPISSSGHLVLLGQIFILPENSILFFILLHLATLIAVVIVFNKTILDLIKHPFSKKMLMLVSGTVVTLILALLFKDFFENAFSGAFLSISFLVTAIFLLIAEWVSKHNKEPKDISLKNTLVMGLFQGFAILPGISRSGATISSAIVQGVEKNKAAEFSFLMSAPIILISFIWEILKLEGDTTNLYFIPTAFGFLFALIFGVIAIKVMLKVIQKANYRYFSFYLIILSFILILNQFVFNWF